MDITGIAQSAAILFWLIAVGVLALVVTRAANNRPLRGGARMVVGLVLLAIIVSTVASGLVFIQPQERGVVISSLSATGIRDEVLQPGLRWVVPFFEYVKTYPISNQTYTMSIAPSEGTIRGDDSIAARTRDGQEIFVDASVIYAIDPTKVVQVHIRWQDRYTDDLVRAQARGIIRDAVSQYGVEEVVSVKRAEMTARIREVLEQKFADNGLVLVDFVMRNIAFSTEYAASVEQKQIAEQQAQQAKFVVESKKQEAEQAREVAKGQADAVVTRAKGDAEARLIQAEAEAKALKLIADAIRDNPDIVKYLYVTKISDKIQVMLLPSNSPFLFPLPTMEEVTVVPTNTPTEVPTP